jgi:hypothetical protein
VEEKRETSLEKIVILLGAGATVSDVATRARTTRPPLDKEFFSVARSAGYSARVKLVRDYMEDTYGVDICESARDSLEQVMGQLYTDLFNPSLEPSSLPAFRGLIRLFNERLASTTNNIAATQKRYVYRILSHYLSRGAAPGDITIVTFNQVLQAEKILQLLASKKKWHRCAEQLFNFPHCYLLDIPQSRVTAPDVPEHALFPRHEAVEDRLLVLKLHGSLNWYSTHNSREPSPQAMFKASRVLRITRRKDIYVDMTISGPSRSQHTLPLVIPPVSHKSAVLHDSLKGVWAEAERRLTHATEIVIFGYSCPALDFESTNMLRRSQLHPDHRRTISLIDPDAATARRYITLLQPKRLIYYPYAKDFVAEHH